MFMLKINIHLLVQCCNTRYSFAHLYCHRRPPLQHAVKTRVNCSDFSVDNGCSIVFHLLPSSPLQNRQVIQSRCRCLGAWLTPHAPKARRHFLRQHKLATSIWHICCFEQQRVISTCTSRFTRSMKKAVHAFPGMQIKQESSYLSDP